MLISPLLCNDRTTHFIYVRIDLKALSLVSKGNVDDGNTEVPQIFVPPTKIEWSVSSCETKFIFLVIDPIKYKKIVDKVWQVSETWGITSSM